MNYIKKFKGRFIAIGIIAIILAISYFLPEQTDIRTDRQTNAPTVENAEISAFAETPTPSFGETPDALNPATGETSTPTLTPVVPSETKEPPAETVQPDTPYCMLTVRCDTLLNQLERLSPEKRQLVPQNGIILPQTKMELWENATVFDILEKTLHAQKIHFEFSKAPMYNSVYIEGIGNLYEFDAGNLSGWIYRVNGVVPSVGCSQYIPKSGDIIEFLYSCNMGKDL